MSAYSRSIACVLMTDVDHRAPVGAGIVLDKRRILTCAHVVNVALGRDSRVEEHPGEVFLKVTVPIPKQEGAPYQVTVTKWCPPRDSSTEGMPEDLAILALPEGECFPSSVQAARLLTMDLNDAHGRRVTLTGFPAAGPSDCLGGVTRGLNDEGRLQIDPERPDRMVDLGFSGAGVWDEQHGGLIAMLVVRRLRRGEAVLAYGIPWSRVPEAFGLSLHLPYRVTLPSLPQHFIPREAFLAPLQSRVQAGCSVGVTALKGMGGLGKTVLATALVHDPAIAASFGAARYWITVGQDGNPVALLAQLYRAVTGEKTTFHTVEEGQQALWEKLPRPSLIVLDDLWWPVQAAAFEGVKEAATLLATTRQGTVVAKLGVEPHSLDVLDLDQSRALLAGWAGCGVDDLPECADAIVGECGYLPLALAVFGAAVSQPGIQWEDGLKALQKRDLADLCRPIPGYAGNEGVFGALDLSFGTLEEQEQKAFSRCAVFPEDRPIPETALAALWHDLPGMEPPAPRRRLCERLEAASLWGRDQDRHGRPAWRLHDLVLDYLHGRLADPAAAHGALVAGYGGSCPAEWAAWEEDDGYFLDELPRHLGAAGRGADQRALVLDFRWLARKLVARTPQALIGDLESCRDDPACTLLARTLRMSAHVLAVDPGQLAPQLVGRLGMTENDDLAALCQAARTAAPLPGVLMPVNPQPLLPPGPLVCTFTGHTGPVAGALVLPGGQEVLSWSADNTICLWSLASGQPKARYYCDFTPTCAVFDDTCSRAVIGDSGGA